MPYGTLLALFFLFFGRAVPMITVLCYSTALLDKIY
jgi:hypothetical protein